DFFARRRVKPLTQRHCARAAAEVLRFGDKRRYQWRTAQQRDKLMVDYLPVRACFDERINLKDALDVPQARLALKGFSKAAPGGQRGPCPWQAALLMIDQGLASRIPRACIFGAAVAATLGYLQLVELLSVMVCNATRLRHSATSAQPQVSIALVPAAPSDCPPSVTAKSSERDDAVTCGAGAASRRRAARLLRDPKAAAPPAGPIFPFAAREFEVLLTKLSVAAGLQRLRLCPRALRCGGASTDFSLRCRALAEAQRHGRWKCGAIVRRHEKT
ncbi:unnamed protein product, partial [Prorocentrum cordatum]